MMRMLALILLLVLSAASQRAAAQPVDSDDLYTQPFLVPDPGVHSAPIWRMDADAAGRFLVTGSHDKTVRVWSRDSGRLLRTIRVPSGPGDVGKIYAVAVSPEGGTIAAGWFTSAPGQQKRIYLFDRASGRQIGIIADLPNTVFDLAFSPDGRRLAAALGGTGGVRLFETKTWRQIAADGRYGDNSLGLAFDKAGRLATTSYDRKIRLYAPDLHLLRVASAPGGDQPYGIAFSPDGRALAVGYVDVSLMDVLDSSSLARLHPADTKGIESGNVAGVTWSPDGSRLFAAGTWAGADDTRVRVWADAGRRVVGDYQTANNTIMSMRGFVDGKLAVAAQDPRLTLLAANGHTLWVTDRQTADLRGQARSFSVDADGRAVEFDFGIDNRSPARFDLGQRQLQLNPAPDPGLHTPRIEGLTIDWQNTLSPTLDGKPLPIDKYEVSRSLAITPDGADFILGSEWSLRRFNRDGKVVWTQPAPGIAYAVNVTADGRVVVAGYTDGTIRWHRLSDGKELLAFFPHIDGKRWVAWTPLGQYVASPGGDDMIQWQINHGHDQAPETFTASRFRDRFYRPDVIERVLQELDPAKALAAADAALGRATVTKSIEGDTPPRVAIIDPADGTQIDRPDVTVAYSIEDRPGTTIRRLRLLLDGRVAATQTNLTVAANGRLSGELSVTLVGEGRLLTLLAESDKGSSDPASVQIHRPAMADSVKPDLYVLAVGVRQFKNRPDLTLDFAGQDAIDFAAQMQAQEGGLYRHVLSRTLTETNATQEAILDGLEWLERQMTTRDVAAVFLSTHGQNDASNNFYLLPYDADVSDELKLRRTAVRYSDLRDTLVKLAERGKTLVFLDACHSGNIMPGIKAGPTDVDKVAADLASSESGVIVFSSSTGSQFSLQKTELGHGVFTYALIEAFKSRNAAHEMPYLYVSDLDVWLRNEVKTLSNGTQTPQTTVPQQRFTNPKIFMVRAAPG